MTQKDVAKILEGGQEQYKKYESGMIEPNIK